MNPTQTKDDTLCAPHQDDRGEMWMHIFRDDITSLVELTFTNGPLKIRHIRQASVIVRRWLCDNELSVLLRHINSRARFQVLDDCNIFKLATSDEEVDYYISAGIKFNGKPILMLYHSSADSPPQWAHDIAGQGIRFRDEKISLALSKKVLYFNGEEFSMDEVLRFACNKLGGAHLDDQRSPRQVSLEQASQYVTFGGIEDNLVGTRPGAIHLSLEPDGSEAVSGVFVAVVAAAAMLVNVRFDGIPLVMLGPRNPTILQKFLSYIKYLYKKYLKKPI